jgi:putative endonuclease
MWRDLAKSLSGFWRIRQIETDMHHVYILLNEAKTRTYTGVADDVEKRLKEHNAGEVKSSRPYRPYKVIHTESFETLAEARQREAFYKSTTGRRRLKDMFFRD